MSAARSAEVIQARSSGTRRRRATASAPARPPHAIASMMRAWTFRMPAALVAVNVAEILHAQNDINAYAAARNVRRLQSVVGTASVIGAAASSTANANKV